MAKCVVCTSINTVLEAKKHDNHMTKNLSSLLKRRWNNTPRSIHKCYCRFHDKLGIGRATWPEAIKAIPQLLEADLLALRAKEALLAEAAIQ